MAKPQAFRVLFVCLGNHCRSPAAHAVAAHAAASRPLIEVDSAGTSSEHKGQLPHRESVAEGHRRGYMVDHRGREMKTDDFARFDLIVVMDKANERAVRRLQGGEDRRRGIHRFAEPDQIQLLRRWDPQAKPSDVQLADPWGKEPAAYAEMYDTIERSMAVLMATLDQYVSGQD
jgi:protein-tyrosine phosphatase